MQRSCHFKIQILLLCLLCFKAIPCLAQSLETKRIVEEQKREQLLQSEYDAVLKDESENQKKYSTTEFFDNLYKKKIVTTFDFYQSLIILTGVFDQYRTVDKQIMFLLNNNIIAEDNVDNILINRPLKKGYAAYSFLKLINLKGGIILHLFGINQRYALKELIYQGMMIPGSAQELITGPELIYSLTKIAEYISANQNENK